MKDKRNIAVRCISWLLLTAAYVFVIVFIYRHAWNQLDADCSSEMYLAKILSQGNGIITGKWDYSTEIRVLGTQIITAFLFRFTNDWRLVRTISTAVHIAIGLAAFYYLLRVLKAHKHFPVAAVMLVFPTSFIYLRYYLINNGYIPFLIITMTSTALILDTWKPGFREIIRRVLIVLLSFLGGLGGPRLLVVYYFPLALAMLLLMKSDRDKLEGKQYSAWLAFGANVIGTVINMKVLSQFFKVQDFTKLSFKFFDINILGDNITYFIRCLGYVEGEFNWRIVLYNVSFTIIILLSAYALYKGLKSSDIVSKIMSAYIAVAWVFYFLLQIFIMRDTIDRYMMPISIMMLPMCVCCITRNLPDKGRTNLHKAVLEGLVLIVCGISFIRIYEFVGVDHTAKWRGAAEYMTEHGIRTGYSTFWNANILVEYSNGYIDMYHWSSPDKMDLNDPTKLRHWLQPVSHFSAFPQGKMAIVLFESEYETCSLKEVLDSVEPAYECDDLRLYVFDSIQDVLDH